jgi:O-antigen/teichoic acid export membrane protein
LYVRLSRLHLYGATMSDSASASFDPSSATRSILYGLSWTYLSVMLQGVLKLLVLIVLARLVSPRDFGLIGYALLCSSFIERVGQMGVGPALVQVRDFDMDVARTTHVLSIVSGTIGTIVLGSLAPHLAIFFGEGQLVPILRVLSIGCVVEGFGAAGDAILQRQLRFKELTIADNLSYMLSMGMIASALAYAGYGVWALVWAQLGLRSIRTVIIYAYTRDLIGGKFLFTRASGLIRVGVGFSLARLLNFFSLQGDNFVVGRLLGTEALGTYSRGYQLMTLPAMYVGQLFERVMFPAMAQQQGRMERLRKQFLFSLEAISLVTIPVAVLMHLFAKEIVLTAFGEQWRGMVPIFAILSVGIFFRTAYKCSDTLARSVGAVYSYAVRQGIYTTMIIGGSWLGARTLGLPGVAWGVVVAIMLNYISMTRLSRKILDVSWRSIVNAHSPGLFLGIFIGLIGWATREWTMTSGASPLVALSMTLVVTSVSGVAWLYVTRGYLHSGVIEEIWEVIQRLTRARLGSARAIG